jgi:hypothetical protein
MSHRDNLVRIKVVYDALEEIVPQVALCPTSLSGALPYSFTF